MIYNYLEKICVGFWVVVFVKWCFYLGVDVCSMGQRYRGSDFVEGNKVKEILIQVWKKRISQVFQVGDLIYYGESIVY